MHLVCFSPVMIMRMICCFCGQDGVVVRLLSKAVSRILKELHVYMNMQSQGIILEQISFFENFLLRSNE